MIHGLLILTGPKTSQRINTIVKNNKSYITKAIVILIDWFFLEMFKKKILARQYIVKLAARSLTKQSLQNDLIRVQ